MTLHGVHHGLDRTASSGEARVLVVAKAHAYKRAPLLLEFLVSSVTLHGVHHGLDRTAPPGEASVPGIMKAHVSENPQTRRLHIHVVAVTRLRQDRDNTAHVSRFLESSHVAHGTFRTHDAPVCVSSRQNLGCGRSIVTGRHLFSPFCIRLVRYFVITHRRADATTTRDDGRTLGPGDVETNFSRTSTRGRLVTGGIHARTVEPCDLSSWRGTFPGPIGTRTREARSR